MYRLTRDDGVELKLEGGIWEAALELAFVYGWRPVGTETPRTPTWRDRRVTSGLHAWNSRDYFSCESQHVASADARALARAVRSALVSIPDLPPDLGDGVDDTIIEDDALEVAGHLSPIPSRASALADGLSVHRRKLMTRLAEFATRGGFTIGGAV